MSLLNSLNREILFAARDRSLWLWCAIVFGLSAVSVSFGLIEVERQHSTIEHLIESNQHERLAESKKLKDWGSAAYYSFHLTYDAPSDFAYAAMGLRDQQPWKHRIRMLALEGQIYERDVGNPSVALIGRFDFSFLTAFIIPLVLIILLYDLRSGEKIAGRHSLLEATAGRPFSLWSLRAFVRMAGVFVCLIVPLIIVGILSNTSMSTLAFACLYTLAYILFWGIVCFFVSSWKQSGSVILMSLIATWIMTATILPAGSRLIIDRLVPVPSGADILLLQRETVNDAWDLPREVTMETFFSRHPEWIDYKPIDSSFEWQWYYAFQQVGDQRTEALSKAYSDGRLHRDYLAAWASVLSPPSLLERALQALANTDLNASVRYEQSIRVYHESLRGYYYPKFFRNEPFDKTLLKRLPLFKMNHDS